MEKQALMPSDAAEKIHRDYKIPMKNIEKAVVVKEYLNKIDKAANQVDIKKALSDIKKINEHRASRSLSLDADFESWSIITTVICDFYRRENLLKVLKRAINEGIKKGNPELVIDSLYLLRSHLFFKEVLDFFEPLLVFARDNKSMQLIHELENWANKKESFPKYDLASEKIFLAKADILLSQHDASGLINILDRFNPHFHTHHVEINHTLRAVNSILKTSDDKELMKMIKVTINLSHTGQEETLAVLAIIELLSRYSPK